jgi:DNA-binding transcriptional LysR family regulator
MDRFQSYQVLIAVAQCQSLTRAAERLGCSKAMVSQRLSELEVHLGVRLFHRTTRSVQLSQDGQVAYERALVLLQDAEELDTLFQSEAALKGKVRIDMPARMARNLIVPRLPEFLALHPMLEIEFSSTDRRVDIISEGFDLVLRVGALKDSNLIARNLGAFAVLNVASPGYLKAFGVPHDLASLAQHQLVHYTTQFGAPQEGFEYFDGSRYRNLSMPGKITVNNADAYEAACLAGLGIVQMPWVGARVFLEQGLLQEVLPQYRAEPMPVHMIYASRQVSKRVRAVLQWMTAVLEPWLNTVS